MLIKSIIRKIMSLPYYIIYKAGYLYCRISIKFDPNFHESFWEELCERKIEEKIGSNMKLKNLVYYKTKFSNKISKLKFYTPNKICSYRVSTFLSKEKEIIEWIENQGGNNVNFFDIGANIGLYSIYYSTIYKSKVFSFEPSFKNLNLLAKNIFINKLEKKILLISTPVSDKISKCFFLINKNIGGMAESFVMNRIQQSKYNYQTNSISLDNYVENFKNLNNKFIIKIDTDGNEYNILQGAKKTISNKNCKSLFIETREKTKKNINKLLTNYNFKLIGKYNSNEIWVKNLLN